MRKHIAMLTPLICIFVRIGSDTNLLDLAGNVTYFGTSITAGNTQFLRQGADLLIRYGTQGDIALIQDFSPSGAGGAQAIAKFQFADGTRGAYTNDGLGNAANDTNYEQVERRAA